MFCRRITIGLLLLGCAGFGTAVTAAQWELKGALGQQLKYDDNMMLRPVKQSLVGYSLTPSLQTNYRTESLELGFNGKGDIRRFNDPSWDCENYALGVNARYRLTPVSFFMLSGAQSTSCAYSQQSEDTGIALPVVQSENSRLAPSWIWQWTPRDQVNLAATYSNTRYSNDAASSATGSNATGYRGNESYAVNLGLNHAWDRRLNLTAGAFFSRTQYGGSNASTQNLFGFQAGGEYLINQYWTVVLNGGIRFADIHRDSNSLLSSNGDSISLGNLANISLSYKSRLSSFSTGYSNGVNPSAIGQTLQVHSIYARYSYEFTPRLFFNVSASFSHSQSIGGQSGVGAVNSFDRDYATAIAAITWDFAKDWKLNGSYVYRWQQYKQQGTMADSNAVMVSLNYAWDGIHDSH